MSAPGSFAYVHSDVPEGMTIAAWRKSRSNGKRRFTWRTFLKGLIGQGWKS